jgi:hypothetical protein
VPGGVFEFGIAIDQDEGRIPSYGLRIDLIVLGMGPEESDRQGSCLILYVLIGLALSLAEALLGVAAAVIIRAAAV